jgi:NADH:ubiquinone oxidoreductase subunit D
MSLYESASGARMHASYYRPGGTRSMWYDELKLEILEFANNFSEKLSHMSSALNENII